MSVVNEHNTLVTTKIHTDLNPRADLNFGIRCNIGFVFAIGRYFKYSELNKIIIILAWVFRKFNNNLFCEPKDLNYLGKMIRIHYFYINYFDGLNRWSN